MHHGESQPGALNIMISERPSPATKGPTMSLHYSFTGSWILYFQPSNICPISFPLAGWDIRKDRDHGSFLHHRISPFPLADRWKLQHFLKEWKKCVTSGSKVLSRGPVVTLSFQKAVRPEHFPQKRFGIQLFHSPWQFMPGNLPLLQPY